MIDERDWKPSSYQSKTIVVFFFFFSFFVNYFFKRKNKKCIKDAGANPTIIFLPISAIFFLGLTSSNPNPIQFRFNMLGFSMFQIFPSFSSITTAHATWFHHLRHSHRSHFSPTPDSRLSPLLRYFTSFSPLFNAANA